MNGGWEGSAVEVTFLSITPLRSSAIHGHRCIHIRVGAGVNERDVKGHLLDVRHEGRDVSVFGDAGVVEFSAQRGKAAACTLCRFSNGGATSQGLTGRRDVGSILTRV